MTRGGVLPVRVGLSGGRRTREEARTGRSLLLGGIQRQDARAASGEPAWRVLSVVGEVAFTALTEIWVIGMTSPLRFFRTAGVTT